MLNVQIKMQYYTRPYLTIGRVNYRTGHHRTVVFVHLPSQAGVNIINTLPGKGQKVLMNGNILNCLNSHLDS